MYFDKINTKNNQTRPFKWQQVGNRMPKTGAYHQACPLRTTMMRLRSSKKKIRKIEKMDEKTDDPMAHSVL